MSKSPHVKGSVGVVVRSAVIIKLFYSNQNGAAGRPPLCACAYDAAAPFWLRLT